MLEISVIVKLVGVAGSVFIVTVLLAIERVPLHADPPASE